MPFARLPVEVVRAVFWFGTVNTVDVFSAADVLLDCVSLIDFSTVCRRWRDIALADPTLWAAPYMTLEEPSVKTISQATYFLDLCLKRSGRLPLTCLITISNAEGDVRLSHPLVRALVAHETRWVNIRIDVDDTRTPNSVICREVDLAPDPPFLLFDKGLPSLKELRIDHASWYTFSPTSITNTSAESIPSIPSLEHLRLLDVQSSATLGFLAIRTSRTVHEMCQSPVTTVGL